MGTYSNPIPQFYFRFTGARRGGAAEHRAGTERGRRAARGVEGTARGRGHVRRAQTLREGRGQQVREEVQAVRRVSATRGRAQEEPTLRGGGCDRAFLPPPPLALETARAGINGHRQLTSIIQLAAAAAAAVESNIITILIFNDCNL